MQATFELHNIEWDAEDEEPAFDMRPRRIKQIILDSYDPKDPNDALTMEHIEVPEVRTMNKLLTDLHVRADFRDQISDARNTFEQAHDA